jgi:trehalose 6-phosphate synthase/phosphatase
MDLHMMRGNKVLEVKASNVNKGTEALRLLGDSAYDFVMAIGDDVTDEDMFRALPPEAVTIHVGDYSPNARYNLGLQAEVLPLLNALARLGVAKNIEQQPQPAMSTGDVTGH